MKKLLIVAMMAVAVSGSAFAAEKKGSESSLSTIVKSTFESRYRGASNVTWTVREKFAKASFTLAGQQTEAFFSPDGEVIGASRKVSLGELPVSATRKIEKSYNGYEVVESIEFDFENEKNYYVSLQKDGEKKILQVSCYGNVSVYRGSK